MSEEDLHPDMLCDAIEDTAIPIILDINGSCSGFSANFFLFRNPHSDEYGGCSKLCQRHGTEFIYKNRGNDQITQVTRNEYIIYKIMGA